MIGRLAAKLAVYLLRHATLGQPEHDILFTGVIDLSKDKLLTNEERQILTAMLLDRLGALPLHAKIKVDGTGKVSVNGRSLDIETADRLRQAAVAMQNNAARNLVRETVTFLAIIDGVHKNVSPEMGLFAKAALWFLQEENELYATLAQGGLVDDE